MTEATEILSQFMDAKEVGAMCGNKSFGWPSYKMTTDPTFPRPVTGRTGPGGTKMWWLRAEIVAWWEANKSQPKPVQAEKQPAFAGEMATQFIRGWFDPPQKQIDRRRRIERSRLKGIKNQKQIRTQGDWQ
jgi:predicted DNA-binding transcriptional regulator AlpA